MIDWQSAPKSATHYNTSNGKFYYENDGIVLVFGKRRKWVLSQHSIIDLKDAQFIKRPIGWPEDDRITVIAQNGNTGGHYMHYDELREAEQKPVEAIRNKYDRLIIGKYKTGNCTVDVYRVLDAFKTGSAAIDHAVKKLLCAEMRGVKDKRQDYLEAIQSIEAELKLLEDKQL